MTGSDWPEMVPERNWRERAGVIRYLPGVPHDIYSEYKELRRRFGIEVANLVLYAYKTWSKVVAKSLAYKMLQFYEFDEMIAYLEEKVSLFDDEGRKLLSSLIYKFRYSYWFERLLNELSKKRKDECNIREVALEAYHKMARRGIFIAPQCIVQYAKLKVCNQQPRKICERVIEKIEKVMEDEV